MTHEGAFGVPGCCSTASAVCCVGECVRVCARARTRAYKYYAVQIENSQSHNRNTVSLHTASVSGGALVVGIAPGLCVAAPAVAANLAVVVCAFRVDGALVIHKALACW